VKYVSGTGTEEVAAMSLLSKVVDQERTTVDNFPGQSFEFHSTLVKREV